MSLSDYTEKTRAAIFANPPRNQGGYQDDPIAVWRYYMRTFGAGLDIYPENDVLKLVGGLYSTWFVKLEFNSHMPKIDNKGFVEWILSARAEVLKRVTI